MHLELSNAFLASLWVRVDACSALKFLRMEDRWRQKLASTFQSLAKKSASFNDPTSLVDYFSHGGLSVNQRFVLRSWVVHNSCHAKSPMESYKSDGAACYHPVEMSCNGVVACAGGSALTSSCLVGLYTCRVNVESILLVQTRSSLPLIELDCPSSLGSNSFGPLSNA